uniref:Uncharacterized protein n=1 Tax=Anopheles farauti TaxID=69004 RepID=A0A182QRV9_9DIPT
METDASSPSETPTCSIDRRLPNQTYISAWRNKAEFRMVYEKTFNSAPDDFSAKEDALQWLNLWKVRQVHDFPVCVRCTHLVLDAQVFDLRWQRDNPDGAEGNATEVKNIYAGAFTRFINFLTEAVGNKRKSIAESVREIGIETYLVELRHLCAHRSVSISIDVFRRSAQYCMDWLKRAYWERELATMAPVRPSTVMNAYVSADYRLSDVEDLFRMYDAVMAAVVREAFTLDMARECAELTVDEKQLLETCCKRFGASRLSKIVKRSMLELRELRLPPNQATVNAICKALFDNCRRMFVDTVLHAGNERVPLGKIHGELFRTLAAIGCLQTFFEHLMVISEQHYPDELDVRPVWAGFWAHRIAVAFQLLKQFKRTCRTMAPGKVARFGDVDIKDRYASKWYQQRLGAATDQHIILDQTIDSPWHLTLSRAYVLARVKAMNEHTKDVVPVLLTLIEPPLPASVQQKVNDLTQIFNKANYALYNDSHNSDTTTVKTKGKNAQPTVEEDSNEIYTAEHLLQALGRKRTASSTSATEQNGTVKLDPPTSKRKRHGLWTEPDPSIDWGSYPLGTCPAELGGVHA